MRFNSATADRATAIVLFALGAAMALGGYVMDRLEIRQIHPASIPGLVPMILGASLMLCAILLARSARSAPRSSEDDEGGSLPDFIFTAVWSCIFALVLVGRIPFAVAAAVYIAGFAGWFMIPSAPAGQARLKAILFVVLFGVVIASAVSALFRYGFLVRLP